MEYSHRFLYGYIVNGVEKEEVIMANSRKEAWHIAQLNHPGAYNNYFVEDKPKLPKFMRLK